MKYKKHGMKHEGSEKMSKEKREHANIGYAEAEKRMRKMEKAMHGKNAGKGYKGYGNSKGCC